MLLFNVLIYIHVSSKFQSSADKAFYIKIIMSSLTHRILLLQINASKKATFLSWFFVISCLQSGIESLELMSGHFRC